jgi:hypothetical protein
MHPIESFLLTLNDNVLSLVLSVPTICDKNQVSNTHIYICKCLYSTLPQGCRECCFSTGGQYFAAVNGTTISIYNTYTCENVGNLRGHNGKVRAMLKNCRL